MASLDDLLTATKNIVVAINGASSSGTNIVTALDTLNTTLAATNTALATLNTSYLGVAGTTTVNTINAATLVRTGAGRLCRVSITTAGSTNGTIYDSTSTGAPTHPIWAIPATLGLVDVSIPVTTGIVVVPGTGQVVTVTYS